MPIDDWGDQFQDVWNDTPGTDHLEDYERSYVETLFETAFTHTAEENERLGYSEDDIDAIRNEFFDYMGLDASDFDWEGWREAMGYE